MRLTAEIYDSGLERERERERERSEQFTSESDQSVRHTDREPTMSHCVPLCATVCPCLVKFMKGSTRQPRGQKMFCLSRPGQARPGQARSRAGVRLWSKFVVSMQGRVQYNCRVIIARFTSIIAR